MDMRQRRLSAWHPGAFEAQSDFWKRRHGSDGRPLVDHLLDAWDLVARHYASWPAVAGFDFLNEPLDSGNIGSFERDAALSLLSTRRRRRARARATQMIALRAAGDAQHRHPRKPEPVGDANLLYAPHLYTVTGGLDSIGYDGDRPAIDADYALAASEALRQGAVLWPGEHGGYVDGFLAQTELFYEHTLSGRTSGSSAGRPGPTSQAATVSRWWTTGGGEGRDRRRPGAPLSDDHGRDPARLPLRSAVAGARLCLRRGSVALHSRSHGAVPPAGRAITHQASSRGEPRDTATSTSPASGRVTRDPPQAAHLVVRPAAGLSLLPVTLPVARAGSAYAVALAAGGGAPRTPSP